MDVLTTRGRLVMVAIHPKPKEIDLHRFFWRELEMFGARLYQREDFEEAVRLELDTVRAGSRTGISFLVTGEPRELSPVVAYQLYMVIQEAVANVVAHSRAAACRVGIFYGESGVRVVVEDNGCGFEHRRVERDAGSTQGIQLGLHAMASRIQ